MNTTSNTNTTCTITNAQLHFYEVFSWWLGGVGSLCISTLGLILNTIAIYILCDKTMRASFFNRLLVCLIIVDNIFLSYAIADAIGMQLVTSSTSSSSTSSYHPFVFVYLVYPARNIVMCISIYMTVGLACERYNSISNPILHRNQESNCRRLFVYGTSVVTFSTIYCIPKFFELKVEHFGCDDLQIQPHHADQKF